jgi:hypothetical protein
MKTRTHTIRGASLKTIEELRHLGTPDWVPYTVTASSHPSALEEAMTNTLHFSGLLRSCSNYARIDETHIDDEEGQPHHIGELLDEAAERLDQAHQEWLENRQQSVRHQELGENLEAEIERHGMEKVIEELAEICRNRGNVAREDGEMKAGTRWTHYGAVLFNAIESFRRRA